MTLVLISGENEFEKRDALKRISKGREVERYDGEELSFEKLQELIIGQTLFTTDSLRIVSGLSDNLDLWTRIPDILSADSNLVLVEGKPDKRTKTYKWLVKHAEVFDYPTFSDKQRPQMIAWVIERAGSHGLTLNRTLASELVARLGHDQMRVDSVLEQLSFVDDLTPEKLQHIVPLAKSESVFGLFEAGLRGRVVDVQRIISYLEQTEGDDGAYMTMGLLASQLFSLNALVLANGDSSRVAEDLGVHPFVLQKLTPLARNITPDKLRSINLAFSRADEQMKSTGTKPWILVEIALIGHEGAH